MVAGKKNIRGEGTPRRSLETARTPSPPAPRTLSCWAGAGAALSGLVSPLGRANPATGYFCVRRVWNPGLGRLRGRLGKLREGKFGRLGGHWPEPRTRARSATRNRPGSGRFERLPQQQRAEGRPARSGCSSGTRPARAPCRRAHSPPPPPRAPGVLGVLSLGEGLPPPAGRAPAPSPRPRARPPVRPARPPAGNARERGACAPGAGRPEGAASLTQGSGMRAARPARAQVTSSGKAAELRSARCGAAGAPVAGGRERRSYGQRTWWTR